MSKMLNKNRKFLFLSPKPPYPLNDGGKIRSYQSLYFLSKIGLVDVLYVSEEKDNLVVERGIKSIANKIYPYYISKWRRLINMFLGLFGKRPLRNRMLYVSIIQKWINDNIENYDAIYCQTLRMVDYVIGKSNADIYVDFVDAVSMNYEKAAKNSSLLHSVFYRIDYKRLCWYEKFVLENVKHSSIISNVDKEYIASRMKAPINLCVIGNMVQSTGKQVRPAENENMILFVGRMDYEPNVIAVINFVRNIFPYIKSYFPLAKFYIVGASPCSRVLKLADKDVIVTGFVDDIYDFYAKATIVVAPMLTGAGIQNKIIQAMELGCCVVTTTIGAEGLDIQNEELVIAKDANDMMKKIHYLLENPCERAKIGEKAVAYIEKTVSESIIFNDFMNFVNN